LAEVGGRILPRNLCTRVSGMRHEEELLEERLVTPLGALDAASDGFTPADIEYAARKASQEALARALRADDDPSPGDELTTKDYLAALAATRATVSEDTVEEFLQDITTIAQL
jgi:SpoVK/Ycf46/Vps4 family AAA+-type ATPase